MLIDADNVSDKYIRLILDELSNDGTITYKRIYGDWTRPALGSWKSVLLDYSMISLTEAHPSSSEVSSAMAWIAALMLEKCFAGLFHLSHPAVWLHHRQECHRFRYDH